MTLTARHAGIARGLFAVAWLGALGAALRLGATARDVNPEQLTALLVVSYLAAWGLVFARARRGRAEVGARCAACTASVLLSLGIVEAPALWGVIDYRAVFSTPTPAWRRPGNRPDPELVFVREGHQRLRWRFQGGDLHRLRGMERARVYATELRFDRDGFRNPADANSADVVVLGDSFVEGPHVAEADLLTARLAGRTGWAVANLGRSGYGPQQELLVLKRYGLPRKPAACVWAFYEGNDLGDVRDYQATRARLAAARPTTTALACYDRSFTRNALLLATRRWLRPEPRRDPKHYTGQFTDRSGRRVPVYFSSDDYRVTAPRTDAPELRTVRAALAEAHALCRAEGVALTVVFIPSKWRVYRGLCAFEPDAVCRSWLVDDLPQALGDMARDLSDDVTFLDLTPRLRREAASGSLPYLADDTHWSAEGHHVAADAVAEALRGVLTPPRAAGPGPPRGTPGRLK